MKNSRIALFIIFSALIASCTHKHDADADLLLVSIEPQRFILEQLIDSGMTVRTLLDNGTNPETYDPSSSERIAVDNADIFFTTGVLPFEKTLEKSAQGTKFVDTSAGVKLLFGTHGHSHHHEGEHHLDADPHYWGSISGVKTIAVNMAKALMEMYPDKAQHISARLDRYTLHLDSLDNAIAAKLEASKGASFVVWHPSLSYFARDYNLNQLSVGQEGKEMSAKGLKDAIEKAAESNAKVFFFQKEYDSRQAQAINEGIGSRLVIINPLEYNWEDQINLIADEIARR